jgi:serine/threonine protein phosphatase PrpC
VSGGDSHPDAPAAPLRIESAGRSEPGQQGPSNEDALGIFERLFIVADGMGGRIGGDRAARLTVEQVERFFREQHAEPRRPWPYPVDRTTSTGSNLLRVALKVANREIRAAASAEARNSRMGATAAAMAVGETQVVVAHLGDVRVYRWRPADPGPALVRLTRDHSVIEEMRAARPDLPDSAFASVPHRNVVTRALGTREEVEPEVAAHALARGDVYLLCSDGLWNTVDDMEMTRTLSNAAQSGDLEAAARQLVEAAARAGSQDDITALLVRVS